GCAATGPDAGTSDVALRDAALDRASEIDASDPPSDDDAGTSTKANRDFTLRARGMSAYAGRPLAAWIVDTTGRNVMAFTLVAAMTDDEFDLRMPDLLPAG